MDTLRCLVGSIWEIFFSWSLMVSIIDRWRNRSWSSRGSVRCFMFLRRGVISSRPLGPQLVKERLGDVALVSAELAKPGFSQVRHGLAVIHVARNKARRQLASQYFAPVIDAPVEFEAIKPTHRGLAPRCDTGKDLVTGNPFVMAYLDGGGIHEGKAGAVALTLLQVGRQGDQHRRSQFNESVVADQSGEFSPAVHQDILGIVGFEAAVVGLVKGNQNRHDFTGG